MKLNFKFAGLFAVIVFVTNTAWAGNAVPLGVELGVATYENVQSTLGTHSKLADAGVNKYTGGRMLQGDGTGLEVDGLSKILFIFDKSNKLAGVLMTLPKGNMENSNFQNMLGILSKKYKLVEKQVPYVGDSYAKFRQGDSIIEIDAPHLSFDMSVRYLTARLEADFNAQSAAERAENKKAQSQKF